MTTISIPSEILTALRIPPPLQEQVLKRELAFCLYEKEMISMGKARILAGMTKWEFIEELGLRSIPRHYSYRDYKDDLAYANSNL